MRLHIRIALLQRADQILDLLPLRARLLIGAGRAGVGKVAGALDEVQLVCVPPGLDIVLADQIQRPDQLHAGEIRAVELRHHGLDLRAVEHAHEDRLNDVVIVVPKRDLVAAEPAGIVIQVPAAHARAEVAGRFVHIVDIVKDVRLENVDGNIQLSCIFFNNAAVLRAVAGVHNEVFHREGKLRITLQLLKKLCHEHGVLAAGDAHGDPVPLFYKLILPYGPGEAAPDFAVEALANAFLDLTAQRCRLLLFHLVLQPGEIAAGEAVCVIASLPQGYGRVKADLSAGTVYYHLFAPIAVIPGQLLRGNSNGAGY